jgi:hypothetical protein
MKQLNAGDAGPRLRESPIGLGGEHSILEPGKNVGKISTVASFVHLNVITRLR